MKITLNIIALVLIVLGGIWFLQGINVLPGSFMTGEFQWAVTGGAMVVAGGTLLCLNRSKGKKD
jgi:hypothetical protein